MRFYQFDPWPFFGIKKTVSKDGGKIERERYRQFALWPIQRYDWSEDSSEETERFWILPIYRDFSSIDKLNHESKKYWNVWPLCEYKREGTRLFSEMLSHARERVTDLIFRAQIAGVGPDALGPDALGGGVPSTPGPGAPGGMTATKADATNVGFAAAAAEDHDAAMAKQGEARKPETIRRSMPRVGRNQPCPCGSGKKYKHCHGRTH